MARGGFRPGAGRPKGTGKGGSGRKAKKEHRATKLANAAESVLKQAIAGADEPKLPKFQNALEFAMAAINGSVDGVEMGDKVRLAIAAMPFQAPKLAEKPVSQGQKRSEKIKDGSSGKYAAPPPPGGRPKVVVDNG